MQSTEDYFAEKLQHFDASQMELTILSSQQAIAADGRLFIIYVRLWECLNPKARDQLFQEQEDWLKRRPGLARDRNEYPEGSISPMTLAIAYTEVTLERLNILEHRLESLRYVGNRVRGATGVSGRSACSKIERLRRHRSIASPKEPLWSAPRPDRRLGCAASGNLTCASGKPRAISWSAQSGDQERHDGTHRNLKSLMINAIQRWELILSCLEHSYPGQFAAARDRAAWMAYSWHHNGWMRRGIYDTPERTALLAGISVGHAELLEELRGGVQAQAISCVGQGGLGGDKHDDLQRLLNLVPESLPAVTIAADPPIVDSSGSEAGASN